MGEAWLRPPGRVSLPLRFVTGVVLVLALALLIFALLMQPPLRDMGLMAAFLAGTAAVTVAAGYTGYRLGWLRHAPRLRWTLIGTYALSSLLTFLNVWVTARLMFASGHDLLLATVLLIYATGIAVALGLFFSEALTERLGTLDRAAQSIQTGQLATRVEITGQDEIADLGRAFNEMAAQLEAAAAHQARTEAMRRDLIAWVSHDLQTPLASIRAIVEALADDMIEGSQAQQRYLRTAQREIQSLSHLIDDLFQMAQLDAGGLQLELARNSLSDLISDTLESFRQLAERGQVDLVGEVGPGTDSIMMDAQSIGRVLDNLVKNALRHTPPGGKVVVRAGRRGSSTLVEVEDSGEGIQVEDRQHIFDRFYRGEKSRSRATGGAGLGLAIARGLIDAHGGEIGADSPPEGGARFWFTLPA
jgi:signal transduction histidine kinase